MSNLIQVGCNVGDEYIFELVRDKKINFCIFIDANKKALEKCKENLQKFFEKVDIDWKFRSEFINCAVSNINSPTIKLHIPTGDDYSNHSSLDETFPTISEHKKGFDSVEVQNFSINSIFNEFDLKRIDYLFIDVEGADRGIIENLNWGKYKILNIKFEFADWGCWQGYDDPEKLASLQNLLYLFILNGYKIYRSSTTDFSACKIQNWVENYNDDKD